MAKSEFKYRDKPSTQCPYLLETTPQSHYVSASHKIVEIVLINRFGKKNIPLGNFWRLADTSKEVYGAQKYLWSVIKRLQKTYTDDVILSMATRKKLKYLTVKLIPKYLYWCKEEKDFLSALKREEVRYNKDITLEENPVVDIDKKNNDDLLDWLDS